MFGILGAIAPLPPPKKLHLLLYTGIKKHPGSGVVRIVDEERQNLDLPLFPKIVPR